MLEEYLAVGEILRPQGVRGELKIKPLTDDPDRYFDLKQIRLRDSVREIRCIRVHEGYVYARIEGIYSRESAEEIRGEMIYVSRADATPLPEDGNFICDLLGCEAVDTEGNLYGKLSDVLQNAPVDVYVFRGVKGELLVPALKRVVLNVSVEERKILLDAQGLRETAVFPE